MCECQKKEIFVHKKKNCGADSQPPESSSVEIMKWKLYMCESQKNRSTCAQKKKPAALTVSHENAEVR